MDKSVKILFEGDSNNPFLIVYKPHNLPSAPLNASDSYNAFSQAAHLFPQIKHIQGKKNIEGGLLHRLDTGTEGLLLIATTQESYEKLSYFQSQGLFLKKYTAICTDITDKKPILEGFPILPQEYVLNNTKLPLFIQSAFRPYGKKRSSVRPVDISDLKNAQKAALKKASPGVYTTVLTDCVQKDTACFSLEFELTKGYRHQIRAHSAWLGFPLVGDALYNQTYLHSKNDATPEELQLFAHTISFPHPITEKTVTFSL